MLTPGLVSITFRKLTPEDVIDLCVRAEVRCIEWGGDVHVPPGDATRAREVGRLTREAGLEVAAYGSYYRLGSNQPGAFEAVMTSAARPRRADHPRLGRQQGRARDRGRRALRDHRRRVARGRHRAARHGITVCLEYHAGTLTDQRESAVALLGELAHPNIEFLWQPTNGAPVDECCERLVEMLPRMRNVHVFPLVADGRQSGIRWRTARWRGAPTSRSCASRAATRTSCSSSCATTIRSSSSPTRRRSIGGC